MEKRKNRDYPKKKKISKPRKKNGKSGSGKETRKTIQIKREEEDIGVEINEKRKAGAREGERNKR